LPGFLIGLTSDSEIEAVFLMAAIYLPVILSSGKYFPNQLMLALPLLKLQQILIMIYFQEQLGPWKEMYIGQEC